MRTNNMDTKDDPVRRCLPVHLWPQADQSAWAQATAAACVLDDYAGRGSFWREPTKRKNWMCYGRWLSYLIFTGELDSLKTPADRVTLERIKEYVLMLQSQVVSETVWSYVTNLHQVVSVFAPERDWGWLYRITAKLKVLKRPAKNKLSRMVPAPDIASWGYNRLDQLAKIKVRQNSDSLNYRDALMVTMLIENPVRLRNLTMVRIEQHLKQDGDRYYLDFAPHEFKTDRYFTAHYPARLTPYIENWLKVWRPLLLKDQSLDAFWIGIRGEPMRPRGIYGCIMNTTEAAFGKRINPHLFRDIAVTSTVDITPEHIGIATSVLGHDSLKYTEGNYLHGSQIVASRRHQDAVQTLRKQFKADFGDPFR